jgi:sugar-specific transcriptional regulator TrmB
MDKKNYRDPIYDVLRSLEENGVSLISYFKGPEAYKAIKGAIPTYSNM